MSLEGRVLAEAVREACVAAAVEAYEDAGIRGLCAEGRLEAAFDAIRSLDLEPVLARFRTATMARDTSPRQE